ncbi:CotH kinase family protein [bacterium]|nr:CotH kinase family protein [bacterium]
MKSCLYLYLILFLSISLNFGQSNAQSLIQSHLPIIIINTNGQPIPDEPKMIADMRIIRNEDGSPNVISDTATHYLGKIGIEKRGSSSQWFFPKKQYAFETRHEDGSNRNVSLLGLPEENDWILYAPYSDKTLMRNVLVYTLWQQTGRYASKCRFCEVVINDEYQGIYVLMEKIKIDDNRIDIANLKAEDVFGDELTGGYVIKVDKTDGQKNEGWESPYLPYSGAWQRVFYQYHDPDQDELMPEQKTYIQNYITAFEEMMHSADYRLQYDQWLDVDSFIDFFLINELSKNVDGFRLSAFMIKDKDSKGGLLKMGPVWDFNLGFGNADYFDGWKTTRWQLEYFFSSYVFKDDPFFPPFWWKRLWEDDSFKYKTALRWNELRETIFSNQFLESFVDSVSVHLGDAVQRNYQCWPDALGQYVWPNPDGYNDRTTYQSEIDWMKIWIQQRLSWMDTQYSTILTSVEDEICAPPGQWTLLPNYPNPFNPHTSINFHIKSAGHVILEIFDVCGRKVQTIINAEFSPGVHAVSFDAHMFASGVYLCRMQFGGYSQVQKMVLSR